jgi:HSP20 family protein
MAYHSFLLGPSGGLAPVFGLRREIDRLFDDAFGGRNGATDRSDDTSLTNGGRPLAAFAPALDVREDARELVVTVDLPGIRPEDVELSVDKGLLTVRGERRHERKEGQEGRWHVLERSHGTFARTLQLPPGVEEDRIAADFEHGVLSIRIPKPARPQPRRIEIGRGASDAAAVQGAGSTPSVEAGDAGASSERR